MVQLTISSVGCAKVDQLINAFLTAHNLVVILVEVRQSSHKEWLWTQNITVADSDGVHHYFVLSVKRNGEIKFLCDSFESDDGSQFGIITWTSY